MKRFITFFVLSASILSISFWQTTNRPTIVFTNESGSINVALNLTANSASQEHLPQFKEALHNTFKQAYPSATWKGSGINTINDKKVGYLEVVTPAIDTEVYNLIFFTDVNSKLLLCTFNCTLQYLEEWQSIGHEIMNSLKVKWTDANSV